MQQAWKLLLIKFYLEKDGQVTYQKDKNGNTLLGAATTVKKAQDGKDVYTTLSAPIQTYLETQMDAFQSKG